MAIVLSDQDWEEAQWKEYEQNGEIIRCLNPSEKNCHPFCKGWQRTIPLWNGLHLQIYEYQPGADLILKSSDVSSVVSSTLSFFITGNVRTILQGLTGHVEELVGRNYLECSFSCNETEEWQAGDRILRVQICLNHTCFLKLFNAVELEHLPAELRQFAEGGIMPYYRQGITTPAMQVVLQQILSCPYQGAMQRIYLEAKALELMTLQFTQFSAVKYTEESLRSDDIERIHQAREILIHQLNQPPSLVNLARQVGLNDYKLKQGFRQVFGKTAFGYLHDYRLEQAQQLLASGQTSIRDVARAVGYTSQSSFAAAFRKKFGVTPKSYQKSIA